MVVCEIKGVQRTLVFLSPSKYLGGAFFLELIGLFFGIEVVDDANVVIVLHDLPNTVVRTTDASGSSAQLKYGLVSAS